MAAALDVAGATYEGPSTVGVALPTGFHAGWWLEVDRLRWKVCRVAEVHPSGLCGWTEMEKARLCPVVGFELERVVVLPRDSQVRWLAHDAGRPVCLAQVALGFVPCRVPFHRGLSPGHVVRNVRSCGRIGTDTKEAHARILDDARRAHPEISPRRRQHADVPVFGDDRGPVAREIDRGHRSRGRRRSGRSNTAATPLGLA